MLKNKKKKAFTLIELLVVIAIIGILVTIAVVALQKARQSARDSKRIADVKQIQTALEIYYNYNSEYPDNIDGQIVDASNTYMEIVPTAPSPADGDCDSGSNQYVYEVEGPENDSYALSFCLGSGIGNLSSGSKTATPSGIVNSLDSVYLATCINDNPSFEDISNNTDYWNPYGIKIDGGAYIESPEYNPILVDDASDGNKAMRFQGGGSGNYSMLFPEEGLVLDENSSYVTRFNAKGDDLFTFAYTINNVHYWNFTLEQWDENVADPFNSDYMKFYSDLGSNYQDIEISTNNVSAPTGALAGEGIVTLFTSESSNVYVDNVRLLEDGVNILSNSSFEDYYPFPDFWGYYTDSSSSPEGYVDIESSSQDVYSGNYSMKVDTTDTSNHVKLNLVDVPLEGNSLDLSFFAKTNSQSNSNVMEVWFEEYSNDYFYDFSSSTWVNNWCKNEKTLTNDFQEYNFNNISPPPSGDTITIIFALPASLPDVFFWIDNVCVTYSE
jgi:prepilin-type N-terminal cleavage/methylation domain-containing protein